MNADIPISDDYEQIYSDVRITSVEKINYDTQVYKLYKKNISTFININATYNKRYRTNILSIVEDLSISTKSKRKLLIPIIDTVSRNMVSIQEPTSYSNNNTQLCHQLSSKTTCTKNSTCGWVLNKIHIGSKIRKKTTAYKIFSKKINSVKEELQILIDRFEALTHNIPIPGVFEKIHKYRQGMTQVRQHKLKTLLLKKISNLEWKKLSAVDKKTYFVLATEYNNKKTHESESVGGKCMLTISPGNYKKYTSKIIEELIRNNIKRREIMLGNFKKNNEKRFKSRGKMEVMFTENELTNKFIDELFKNYATSLLQRFNVFLIDSPEEDYDISNRYFINSSQIVEKKTYDYKIRVDKKKFGQCKKITLNQSEYAELEQFILEINKKKNNQIITTHTNATFVKSGKKILYGFT